MSALLEVRGVRVVRDAVTILEHADLAASPGRLVAVVGPNGAGKSTLVRAAVGLQPIAAGTIRWGGEDVRRLRGRRLALLRAFVPQRGQVPAGLRVRDAVELGRAPHVRPFERPTRRDADAVEQALQRAGAAALAERRMTTLSGGELQRVQIAVALAQEAPALIADEPTAHLDLGATAEVARLLRGLADDGLAVVVVAHDLALAAAIADEAVVVSEGRTVATGRPGEVLDPDCLRSVWHVDAALDVSADGRTALRVGWIAATTPSPSPIAVVSEEAIP